MLSLKEEFIFYSSAVIFGFEIFKYVLRKENLQQKIQGEENFKIEEKISYQESEMKNVDRRILEAITCPINQTFLRYPLINQYGFSIEKNSHLRWVEEKQKCPFTSQPVEINDLRFNKNLFMFIKFLILKERYNKVHPDNEITYKDILN